MTMTTELTKTAPNNHGPIYETDLYNFAGWLTTRPGVMAVGSSCEAGPMAEAVGEYIKTFPERFALTQRPAAQTEREAFEAWWPTVGQTIGKVAAWEAWHARAMPALQQATPGWSYAQVRIVDENTVDIGRVVAFADERATPEPLTLGPLAKRNIYDAIRGAYDLGYNDARNARTVPGDSAPGYDGRSVEEDHGGALFNTLNRRLAATPEPVGEPVAWQRRDRNIVTGEWSEWREDDDPEEELDPEWAERRPLFTRPAPVETEPVGEAALLVAEILSLADDYAEAEAKAGGLAGCGGDIGEQHELDEDAAYIKGRLTDAVGQLADISTRPAPGVPEDVADLLCSVADNLNDMPITDEYAAKTAKTAYDLLVKHKVIDALAAAKAKGAPGPISELLTALGPILAAVGTNDGDSMGSLNSDDKVLWTVSSSWSADVRVTLGDLRKIAIAAAQAKGADQ